MIFAFIARLFDCGRSLTETAPVTKWHRINSNLISCLAKLRSDGESNGTGLGEVIERIKHLKEVRKEMSDRHFGNALCSLMIILLDDPVEDLVILAVLETWMHPHLKY